MAVWLLPLAARAPWSLLGALLLVRFADEWVGFFPAGSIEPIRAELGLSYAEIGLVVAALPAGGLFGGVFAVAADFVDRRWLSAAGAAVYGLCLVAFAVGDSFAGLLVAGLIWGAAGDAFVQGCEVTLVDLYRDDVAPAVGRVNAYGALGDLLSPLTLAATAGLGWSWRSAFALGGAAMLLYAVWLATQRFPAPIRPSGSARRAVLEVVRDRRVLVLGAVAGLYGLLDEPFLGFAAAFLERERRASPALATTAISLSVAAAIAGFLAVPWFTTRWSPARLLTRLTSLMVLEVAAFVLVPLLAVQAAALTAFGFSGALFYAVLKAHYLTLRPGQTGTTKAVVAALGHAGVAFPVLVGAVSDAFGLTVGLALYATVPLAMLLLVVGAGVARERGRTDEEGRPTA